VPHLNELHSKFHQEGLTVLGVTSEGKAQTEPWIAQTEARYAYAYDKGSKFARACGVRGIPHAVLVDATGKVLHSGSPSAITQEMVREAVKGALKTPLHDLPKELAKVRTLIAKGDIAGALAEAQSVAARPGAPAEAASLIEGLAALPGAQLEAARTLGAKGDWLEAQRTLDRLQKSARGLPEEAEARRELARMAEDAAVQKELKAQKALEKILAMPARKEKEIEARKDALATFIKKNPGSYAATEAERRLAAMNKPE
jgi:hypothetical protein